MFMPKRTTVGCLALGVMFIAQLVRQYARNKCREDEHEAYPKCGLAI